MLQTDIYQSLIQSYKAAKIQGLVVTKCDEANRLGGLVSMLCKEKLPWVLASDGQKIPDDLHEMSVDKVMKCLLHMGRNGNWFNQDHLQLKQEHLISVQEKMLADSVVG